MLSPHREAKLQARRDLHQGLQDTAYLYLSGNIRGPVKVVNVRSLTEWGALGDVKGTSLVYAERNDTRKPQIIFLVEEHVPETGDIVALAAGDVWRVDNVEPVYNITQAANVARLGPKEERRFKTPPSVVGYSVTHGLLPFTEIEVDSG